MGKAHTADVLFIAESDIRSIQPCEVGHIRPLNPHQRNTEPAEWEHGLFDLPSESSTVVLTRDFRKAGLTKGDLGVITACDAESGTYQFQPAVGRDWNGPLLTVRREDIRFWKRDEIATVRKITPSSPASEDG